MGMTLIDTRDIPLRFLIHFMGDLHQPLHLAGRDKGGNAGKLVWIFGKVVLERRYIAIFKFEGHTRKWVLRLSSATRYIDTLTTVCIPFGTAGSSRKISVD